jgi:hypothetical protein
MWRQRERERESKERRKMGYALFPNLAKNLKPTLIFRSTAGVKKKNKT